MCGLRVWYLQRLCMQCFCDGCTDASNGNKFFFDEKSDHPLVELSGPSRTVRGDASSVRRSSQSAAFIGPDSSSSMTTGGTEQNRCCCSVVLGLGESSGSFATGCCLNIFPGPGSDLMARRHLGALNSSETSVVFFHSRHETQYVCFNLRRD